MLTQVSFWRARQVVNRRLTLPHLFEDASGLDVHCSMFVEPSTLGSILIPNETTTVYC